MSTSDKEYRRNKNDGRKDAAEYGNSPHVMNNDNSGDSIGNGTKQEFNDGMGDNPNFSYQSKIAKAPDEKHPKSHDGRQMQNKDKS